MAINAIIVFSLTLYLGGLDFALALIAPLLLIIAALNALFTGVVYATLRGKLNLSNPSPASFHVKSNRDLFQLPNQDMHAGCKF